MSETETQPKFGALAAVLATNLDNIADLPDYIAPPAGVYKLLIKSCEQKNLNEKAALVVNYVILENVSLNDVEGEKEELATIKFGKDMMSEAFFFDKAERIETVLSVLKKKFGGLGAVLGTTNLMEILDKMPNMTIQATLGRRGDDNDSSKFYPYTKNIVAAV